MENAIIQAAAQCVGERGIGREGKVPPVWMCAAPTITCGKWSELPHRYRESRADQIFLLMALTLSLIGPLA